MTDNNLVSQKVLNLFDCKPEAIIKQSTSASASSPQTLAYTKAVTAKVHALREIQELREKTQAFVGFLESTALFRETGHIIDELLIKQLLTNILEPTLNNQRLPGISQDEFLKFRYEVFKSLIDKYVDNSDE